MKVNPEEFRGGGVYIDMLTKTQNQNNLDHFFDKLSPEQKENPLKRKRPEKNEPKTRKKKNKITPSIDIRNFLLKKNDK